MGVSKQTPSSAPRPTRLTRQSASPELTAAVPATLAPALPGSELVHDEPAMVDAKRIFDIASSLTLIVLLLPLMALIAALVRLDSRGPALFRQRRLGIGLKTFSVLKFRTMHTGVSSELHKRYIAELARGEHEESGGLKKLTRDPRVTRVGALLRKISLDELPQLFNVLAGQMSLVGPRPALDYELEHYAPVHFQRFNIRPGITGLWQVSGRSELGFTEMLELDAQYARDADLTTDVRILLRTPRAVFGRTA